MPLCPGQCRWAIFSFETFVSHGYVVAHYIRGRSSVVEHLLPKQNVVGSIPTARSNF